VAGRNLEKEGRRAEAAAKTFSRWLPSLLRCSGRSFSALPKSCLLKPHRYWFVSRIALVQFRKQSTPRLENVVTGLQRQSKFACAMLDALWERTFDLILDDVNFHGCSWLLLIVSAVRSMLVK